MKKKRIQSQAQQKASKRNWCKGLVTCQLKHCRQLKESKGLSFAEQMKVLQCKKILEEMLMEWEPVLL